MSFIKRPVLIFTIGLLIGIILGLYLEISIALIYCAIICVYIIIEKVANRNIKRYFKIFKIEKIVLLICVSMLVGYIYIKTENNKYIKIDNIPKENNKIIGVVLKKEKLEYSNTYIVKGKIDRFFNKKFIIYTGKNLNFEIGDLVLANGELQEISEDRNYKGFNYKEYLKTKKIFGIINTNNIKVIEKNKINFIYKYTNILREKIIENININLPNDTAGILKALVVGDKSNIEDNIIESFRTNNLAHLLAISGLHISCIVLSVEYILKKVGMPIKCINIIMGLILIEFIIITGFTASVIRASIMYISTLVASILHYKSDICTNIAMAFLITIILNPFSILDIGLQLSYLGTIGILLFAKNIKSRKSKIKESIKVTLSAQILITPISIYKFNNISLYFILTNLIANPLMVLIINVGLISVTTSFIFTDISKIAFLIVNYLIKLLLLISKLMAKLPLASIYLKSINIKEIFFYYIVIFLIYWNIKLKNKIKLEIRLRNFEKQILNKKILIKTINVICLIFIIINLIYGLKNIIKKDLNIYFIDVGQGDSTLIVTPNKKITLIDAGDNKNEFLVSYLLDRKINKIDYVIISHFDSDHCNGILDVIEKLKVENLVISKQIELTEEYKNIIEKCKQKNINIITVKANDKIYIDKEIVINILYPLKDLKYDDLNNNSIVCKLEYKKFSILFTGDIEEKAENELLGIYKNSNILKSTAIKISHHGSKTSSSETFLTEINGKIALIGVGKNNKFGHPNSEVIERLKNLNYKIFRTDLNGEVILNINKKEKIKINTHINN